MKSPSSAKVEQFEALKDTMQGVGDSAQLLDMLVEFCIESQERYSEEERSIFGEMLIRFMPTIDRTRKCNIAEKFARLKRSPLKMMRYLSLEPIDVASVVLRYSPVLSEDDLIVVTRLRGLDHKKVIAQRENLPMSVVAKLVRLGNEEVWEIIVKNTSAQISERTFKTLLQVAHGNEAVFRALLQRDNIPKKIMRQIVAEASDSLKGELGITNDEPLLNYLDEDPEESIVKDPAPKDLAKLSKEIEKKAGGDLTEEHEFFETIVSNDRPTIICMFSHMTKLSLDECKTLLEGRDFDPVLLACKAIGLTRETVDALLNSGPWNISLTAKRRQLLLKSYDNLSEKIARDVLTMRVKISQSN